MKDRPYSKDQAPECLKNGNQLITNVSIVFLYALKEENWSDDIETTMFELINEIEKVFEQDETP